MLSEGPRSGPSSKHPHLYPCWPGEVM